MLCLKKNQKNKTPKPVRAIFLSRYYLLLCLISQQSLLNKWSVFVVSISLLPIQSLAHFNFTFIPTTTNTPLFKVTKIKSSNSQYQWASSLISQWCYIKYLKSVFQNTLLVILDTTDSYLSFIFIFFYIPGFSFSSPLQFILFLQYLLQT